MDQPTQSDLKSLLASIEEVQSKILQTLGPSEQIKKGWAAELEPLKTPVFFLWELLGYGTPRELSEKGAYSGAYSFISSATSSDTTRSLDVV